MINTNEQDLKYSPCKNSETEKEVYQQQSAMIKTGSTNQNIIVDCVADYSPQPLYLASY